MRVLVQRSTVVASGAREELLHAISLQQQRSAARAVLYNGTKYVVVPSLVEVLVLMNGSLNSSAPLQQRNYFV